MKILLIWLSFLSLSPVVVRGSFPPSAREADKWNENAALENLPKPFSYSFKVLSVNNTTARSHFQSAIAHYGEFLSALAKISGKSDYQKVCETMSFFIYMTIREVEWAEEHASGVVGGGVLSKVFRMFLDATAWNKYYLNSEPPLDSPPGFFVSDTVEIMDEIGKRKPTCKVPVALLLTGLALNSDMIMMAIMYVYPIMFINFASSFTHFTKMQKRVMKATHRALLSLLKASLQEPVVDLPVRRLAIPLSPPAICSSWSVDTLDSVTKTAKYQTIVEKVNEQRVLGGVIVYQIPTSKTSQLDTLVNNGYSAIPLPILRIFRHREHIHDCETALSMWSHLNLISQKVSKHTLRMILNSAYNGPLELKHDLPLIGGLESFANVQYRHNSIYNRQVKGAVLSTVLNAVRKWRLLLKNDALYKFTTGPVVDLKGFFEHALLELKFRKTCHGSEGKVYKACWKAVTDLYSQMRIFDVPIGIEHDVFTKQLL